MVRTIKTASRLATTLLATAIAVGCGNKAPLAPEYEKVKVEKEEGKKLSREMPTVELECLIEDVQHTSISCFEGEGNYRTSPGWPIVYVMVNAGGKNKSFIYPYGKGICNHVKAKIKFRPIDKTFSSKELIENFVDTGISPLKDYPLSAEGIITADGIKYLEE